MTTPEDPDPWAGYDDLTPEQLLEQDAEAAYEAMYGTFTEQMADAVEAEAEAIVAEAWSAYLTDTYIISSPDDLEPPEPEASP